ncbi:GNAT family N-acetyltransferase [Sphingomonas jaspsi]|uniref:GNAT family N-acetyltransferase n=1 Tax=Sphingomonas jaspsi TaxID=392409 RepID=UPI001C54D436|nr:GNAT family N-acetyltransferase [Sphingomonas jaspsi]
MRDLLAHHFAEMRADSPPEACHVLPIDGLRREAIRFFSLRDAAGTLLAVGALKRLEDKHGEVKSMRTHPDALGTGVGGTMLDHLTAVARSMGVEQLSLETGNSPLFDAANRLYQREGFVRCGPFGDYADTPFTHFYTKALS